MRREDGKNRHRGYFVRVTNEFRRLKETWQGKKPLIKLFKTNKNYYVYDAGTNRIFSCGLFEYEFLNNLLKLPVQEALDIKLYSCNQDDFARNLQYISDLIRETKILTTTQIDLGIPKNIDRIIHNSLGQIILEVTERCNLRCRYCIYEPSFRQARNHGDKDMSWDIAFRAIDYLSNCSSSKEKVAVSFYGGEPLLRFPFIKECVKYAKARIPNNKLLFSMITNGTLINSEIANFLSENGFAVHVSLDGPEVIHNENRIYPNGKGSFLDVKTGMECLFDAYDEQNKKRISISMVYSAPYSEEKLDKIATLWEEQWLPKDILFSFSYAKRDISPQQMILSRIDYSVLNWAIKRYMKAYEMGIKPHPLAAQYLERKLAAIHQRFIFDNPAEECGLNGCCYPGARKIYISAGGTIYLCERIGTSPSIGDVSSGIDVEKLNQIYLVNYRDQSEPECCYCWLARLCDICYSHAFYDGALNMSYKKFNCEVQKAIFDIFLQLYCRLYEINPEGLDYLLKMEIS